MSGIVMGGHSLGSVPLAFVLIAPLFVSLALTFGIEKTCVLIGLFDHPGERKMQKQPVPRMGGLGFLASALFFGLILSVHVPFNFVLGAVIVFIGGFYDDMKNSNTVVSKLVFQIPAALIFSVYTDLGYLGAMGPGVFLIRLLIFALVFFMTNAANLMDNMNGLTSGLSCLIILGLSAVALLSEQFDLALLGVLVAMSVLGFLVRNFPFGKIFMGDQGSQFLGYFLAAFAILVLPSAFRGSHLEMIGETTLVVLLLFMLFFYDVFSVVMIRLKEKRSPFVGDQCHISHRLVRKGLTPTQAALFLQGVQGLIVTGVVVFIELFH